jgi:hypothetical protein
MEPTGTTTTTINFPELTRLPEVPDPPKQNYIEFNSYEITLPAKVRLVGAIRIYSGGRFGNIGGIGSSYFPFVSTVVVRTGKERITYYRLINSNGQVVFITDEEGILTLFENLSSANDVIGKA